MKTSPVKEKREIKKSMRRTVISAMMLLTMAVSFFPEPAHADVWGASFAAEIMGQLMTTIKRQIEGALLGTLKMAAIQMLNSKVGQLIGGVGGGKPLFITDFNEFLYQAPTQKANLYMNDFFSLTTRGKGSSLNYISAAGSQGLGRDYASYLRAAAERATVKSLASVNTYSLDDMGGADAIFASGNLRGLNAFFSNPANNTFGYTLQAQSVYQQQIDMERQVAMMKATASGFLPSEKNGMVMAPAATIESALNNVQDLGNKMIAAASNPGEILSGVVSSMANKLVSNMIQKGVGQVQAKISSAINKVDNKITGQLNSVTRQLGPAAQYIGKVNQGLNVVIKTNTPPPPPPIDPDP